MQTQRIVVSTQSIVISQDPVESHSQNEEASEGHESRDGLADLVLGQTDDQQEHGIGNCHRQCQTRTDEQSTTHDDEWETVQQ